MPSHNIEFQQTLTQPIVTQINHAIGAEGVLSSECKEVVSQYGDLLWDLLISGVGFYFLTSLLSFCFDTLELLYKGSVFS